MLEFDEFERAVYRKIVHLKTGHLEEICSELYQFKAVSRKSFCHQYADNSILQGPPSRPIVIIGRTNPGWEYEPVFHEVGKRYDILRLSCRDIKRREV